MFSFQFQSRPCFGISTVQFKSFVSHRPKLATTVIRHPNFSIQKMVATTKSQITTPTVDTISRVLSHAVSVGKLSDEHPISLFYDLDAFRSNCKSLISSFPSSTLHGFALKAAPFPVLLRQVSHLGIGGECASISELAICQAAGLSSDKIIYDSPAKTNSHLRKAFKHGVHVNADCLEELSRMNQIFQSTQFLSNQSTVGLRVNPQVGDSDISETFTASKSSKFGTPLKEQRDEIIKAFNDFKFLSAIHIHVGSQGCSMDVLIQGIKEAVDLADEINETYQDERVKMIDIGGGLSTNYWGDEEVTSFEQLSVQILNHVPGLYRYKIITEFGRRIAAKTAFIAARVQSVKQSGGKTYVITHVGADMLLRAVYQPKKWGHRIEVYDPEGNKKTDNVTDVQVAGPLCFSGDIIAVDRPLPIPNEGDYIVVRDTGAYTMSMHCRHTNQLMPGVYGFENDNLESLHMIKRPETIEDVVAMWS